MIKFLLIKEEDMYWGNKSRNENLLISNCHRKMHNSDLIQFLHYQLIVINVSGGMLISNPHYNKTRICNFVINKINES